jgi:hypothetical protein
MSTAILIKKNLKGEGDESIESGSISPSFEEWLRVRPRLLDQT